MSKAPVIPPTHGELVQRAGGWLRKIGCGIVFTELATTTTTGEIPDAIGWKFGGQISILVECKVSRADFLADRAKRFRANPELGMGDWRFYLCPPGIIEPADLPPGWGLLYYTPRMTRVIRGVPDGSTRWSSEPPFKGDKRNEMIMMTSALRRIELRGLLHHIYDRLPNPTVPGPAPEPPMDVARLTALVGPKITLGSSVAP